MFVNIFIKICFFHQLSFESLFKNIEIQRFFFTIELEVRKSFGCAHLIEQKKTHQKQEEKISKYVKSCRSIYSVYGNGRISFVLRDESRWVKRIPQWNSNCAKLSNDIPKNMLTNPPKLEIMSVSEYRSSFFNTMNSSSLNEIDNRVEVFELKKFKQKNESIGFDSDRNISLIWSRMSVDVCQFNDFGSICDAHTRTGTNAFLINTVRRWFNMTQAMFFHCFRIARELISVTNIRI